MTNGLDVITALAAMASKEGASDIHLESSGFFYYRIDGRLEKFNSGMDEAMVKSALGEVWPGITQQIEQTGSADRSAVLDGIRVRANISKTIEGLSCVMRLIPDTPPTLDELMVPPQIARMADYSNGLILATGSFGSGKTSLLAALIAHRNHGTGGHILCLEEPTEFVHLADQARITQREIGEHTSNWHEGIRAARRSDPDILMVGELREAEAVEAAIAAAASGILVMATLHAGSTVEALTALLGMVSDDRRELVRTQLGQSLRGVVTQQLLPRVCQHCHGDQPSETGQCAFCAGTGKKGRIATREVLTGTDTVRAQVMSGNFAQIKSTIQSGRTDGMWLMKDDLVRLVLEGEITEEDACANTAEPQALANDIALARKRHPQVA